MKTHTLVAALFLALSAKAFAINYTLEPNYTQVVLSWDHLGYSHPTAQIAQGQGMVDFDAMDPTLSTLQVTLPLASLITGVPDLDERLKSADFFDVAQYPRATFTSTRVEKTMKPDQLKVTGNLTIRNVTRPVVLDVSVLKQGANARTQVATVGFNATGKLKRSDFGLGAFVPQVGDEIMLRITCQGAEAKAYAAYLKAKEVKEKSEKH